MSVDIYDVRLIDDRVVVYARVERVYSSWDPQDEYVYEEDCFTTIDPTYWELSPVPSIEEVQPIIDNFDHDWHLA